MAGFCGRVDASPTLTTVSVDPVDTDKVFDLMITTADSEAVVCAEESVEPNQGIPVAMLEAKVVLKTSFVLKVRLRFGRKFVLKARFVPEAKEARFVLEIREARFVLETMKARFGFETKFVLESVLARDGKLVLCGIVIGRTVTEDVSNSMLVSVEIIVKPLFTVVVPVVVSVSNMWTFHFVG